MLRSPLLRRAMACFLPLAVLATLTCGLAYALVQQDLRSGANDPQIQMAEDAARALDAGAQPSSQLGSAKIDLAQSLAPFLVIFDRAGAVIATDGQLDGHAPVPPLGVLEAAQTSGSDRVTWQPRQGVRIATVSVRWSEGTVMVGRSLREVEIREDAALQIALAAWLVMLVSLAVAALVAAHLWPSQRAAR